MSNEKNVNVEKEQNFILGEMIGTNVPQDDPITFFNMEDGTGTMLSKAKRFVLKYYMSFNAERLDKENGELIPAKLIKCMDKEGNIVYSTGVVACKSLQKLIDRFGDTLKNRPLELEVYTVDLNEGTGHSVRVVGILEDKDIPDETEEK